jgi:hypothetical protein
VGFLGHEQPYELIQVNYSKPIEPARSLTVAQQFQIQIVPLLAHPELEVPG